MSDDHSENVAQPRAPHDDGADDFTMADVTHLSAAHRLMLCAVFPILIDIKVNEFDVFHDLLGTLLFSAGVARLLGLRSGTLYRRSMQFVLACALANCLDLMLGGFPHRAFAIILTLANTVAAILFCTAMKDLAEHWKLTRSARRWKMTRGLFQLIWVLPVGAYVILVVSKPTTYEWDVPFVVGMVFLILIYVPVVHLLVSMAVTMRDARDAH